jgi:hypothetical protein
VGEGREQLLLDGGEGGGGRTAFYCNRGILSSYGKWPEVSINPRHSWKVCVGRQKSRRWAQAVEKIAARLPAHAFSLQQSRTQIAVSLLPTTAFFNVAQRVVRCSLQVTLAAFEGRNQLL